MITRRSFLQAATGLTLSAPWASAETTRAYPPGRYVDIHTHLTHRWGAKPELQVSAMLAWMDQYDMAQAIVLPLISPEAWDHPISTDYVLRHTEDHRDRLIPFCSIDPRTTNMGSYALKLDMLKKYQDAGAKGFGEHKPGVAMDDPRNLELFRACGELGLPVLFHLDNQRNWDEPGLPALERVLKTLPETVFIGHATGFWASISGEVTQEELAAYPKRPVAPGGALDRLLGRYPNLYGDLSAGSGANAIQRDTAFGREFLIRHAGQLLYGTDYLAPGQEVPQLTLFEELDLPDAAQAAIFRDNARRLLAL